MGYTESATNYLDLQPGNGTPDGAAAVYVHFPFCRHICTYCDFDTFAGIDDLIGRYVDAAVVQVQGSPHIGATSLYVGGGTPSIMEPSHAASLVKMCRHRFGLTDDAEATIELNPTDGSLERLAGFRAAGFNRLSIGVQSTDSGLLKLLGRRHRHEDTVAAVDAARRAGFQNVSLDLIYGVPRQTLETWKETLEAVMELGVEHLSCYMLTVEPGTPMERGVSKSILRLPDEEAVVAMYEHAAERLRAAGYVRYEISNWAIPGRESRHNITYWCNGQYLGIGAGAAGYWNGRRYKILPSVQRYIDGVSSGRIPLAEDECVTARRAMSDTLILGLRLAEGVSATDFEARFGEPPDARFGDALGWAEAGGLLERSGGRFRLTGRGILLSNELFERLL